MTPPWSGDRSGVGVVRGQDQNQLQVKRATARQILVVFAALSGAGMVGGGAGVAAWGNRLTIVETQIVGLKEAVQDLTTVLRENAHTNERIARLEADVEHLKRKGSFP